MIERLAAHGLDGVFERGAVGTQAARRVDRDDIGACGDAGARMAGGRRDVNALVALFPQTDDGNLDAALDGGDIGEALATNGRGAAQLGRTGDLGHGLGWRMGSPM